MGIATGYRLDRPGFECLFYWYRSSFRAVQRRGRLDHSPPFVTRSKLTGAILLLPIRPFRACRGTILPSQTSLQGVQRDNFTFTYVPSGCGEGQFYLHIRPFSAWRGTILPFYRKLGPKRCCTSEISTFLLL
jgi:hypothetical protein